MYYIVLDTNILVSALLTPNGMPAKVMNLIYTGIVLPCYDQRILDEYESVLLRVKFKFDTELVYRLIALIRDVGLEIIPKTSYIEMPDENDRKFYETAKTAGVYLVTGNAKHFPKETWIVSPAELYARIAGKER